MLRKPRNKCLICGEETKRHTTRFCSYDCSYKWRKGKKFREYTCKYKANKLCLLCKKEFFGTIDRKFCSKECSGKYRFLNNIGMKKFIGSVKGKKLSESRKKKLSEFAKKRIGKLNPMYGRKISDKVRKIFEEHNKKRTGKLNPMYGKKAPHGKGFWYEKKDGTKVWMRSSWEGKYAKYLDSLDINWLFEYREFPVRYDKKGILTHGTYRPDFYLIDTDEYAEVKGYWRDDALPKYLAFKRRYPYIKIKLIDEIVMKQLGLL